MRLARHIPCFPYMAWTTDYPMPVLGELVSQHLSKIVNAIAYLAAIATVVGGVIAVYTYREDVSKRQDDKSKQVLEFVRLFNGEEFIQTRIHVVNLIDQGVACNLSIITGADRIRLFTYVDFFDSLHICVESGLCSKTVSEEFFQRYANYHWPALRAHIEDTRKLETGFKTSSAYGDGLEKLAVSPLLVRTCEQGGPR
jgi:hypothetical protein